MKGLGKGGKIEKRVFFEWCGIDNGGPWGPQGRGSGSRLKTWKRRTRKTPIVKSCEAIESLNAKRSWKHRSASFISWSTVRIGWGNTSCGALHGLVLMMSCYILYRLNNPISTSEFPVHIPLIFWRRYGPSSHSAQLTTSSLQPSIS